MSTEIKFEIGKAYKTRADKRVVLNLINEDDQKYPYFFSDGCWRAADGQSWINEELPSNIIGEWTPDDEIALIESQIADTEAKRAELVAALDAARKAKKEAERVPWEPKGGKWSVDSRGDVTHTESLESWRRAGAEYPTREAAAAACDRIVFFQRMCALATELNPSGKVGGRFYTYLSSGEWLYAAGCIAVDAIWETEDAARAACEIMNRDKWEVPG